MRVYFPGRGGEGGSRRGGAERLQASEGPAALGSARALGPAAAWALRLCVRPRGGAGGTAARCGRLVLYHIICFVAVALHAMQQLAVMFYYGQIIGYTSSNRIHSSVVEQSIAAR